MLRILSIACLSSLLFACGGGGSTATTTTTPTTTTGTTSPVLPPQSIAPPVAAPTSSAGAFEDPEVPQVDNVVLRHVHRNAFGFPIDVNGAYNDSPNAVVEIRGPLDIYFPIDQNDDETWTIEPENNGLAYFRVVNTKPNGSVRVHNFYGVPVGHYITLDSTDVPNDIPDSTINSECKMVDVQVAIATDDSSIANLQINGTVRARSTESTNEQTRIKDVQLCTVNDDYYFVIATWESEQGSVEYGFNYYQRIEEGDLLELELDHLSSTIPWSTDVNNENRFVLRANESRWSTTQKLFTGDYADDALQLVPVFDELAVDTFVFSTTDGVTFGQRSFEREFAPDATELNFDLNDIIYEDIKLSPTGIKWQSNGVDHASVISGVVFNSQLTQTYAFMSMDPDVINDRDFDFPLQDIELMLDSSFILMNATAPGKDSGNLNYLTTAGIFSGFVYLPNGIDNQRNYNSDHLISVNISETLELLLIAAWEQLVVGWEEQQSQN